MQSAYEILSDPHERAWYDNHRDSILRGGTDDGEHYEHNIRVTTAEDIMQIFSRFSHRTDFSDSPTGFFGALKELFDGLAEEEEVACQWNGVDPVQYPSFGHKDDDYEGVVRAFYSTWNSFATKKTFAWKDVYNYLDAPDRQTRRIMEKENKRFRDEGVREFNDAVRSLVAFIRKRDPRFKPNKQSEADRQRLLKDAAIAQGARSRAANQAKVNGEAVPEWMKPSVTDIEEEIHDEWVETSPVKQDVECVICNKTFKSEKQYEAHERSKKHIKAAEQIRRQMQRENRDMNLDSQEEPFTSPDAITTDMESIQTLERPNTECHPSIHEESAVTAIDENEAAQNPQDHNIRPSESDSDSYSDEDYAPRAKIEQRLFSHEKHVEQNSDAVAGSQLDTLAQKLADESIVDNSETKKKPKLGKAKERRAKKAAQQSAMSTQHGADFKCAACSEVFLSKTRLFRHIKDLGHAQPMQKETKIGKGRGL